MRISRKSYYAAVAIYLAIEFLGGLSGAGHTPLVAIQTFASLGLGLLTVYRWWGATGGLVIGSNAAQADDLVIKGFQVSDYSWYLLISVLLGYNIILHWMLAPHGIVSSSAIFWAVIEAVLGFLAISQIWGDLSHKLFSKQ